MYPNFAFKKTASPAPQGKAMPQPNPAGLPPKRFNSFAGVKPLGSFKKGGDVKKTGLYKLHKGEKVLTAKHEALKAKMGKKEAHTKGFTHRTDLESPEQQAKNRAVRKGTKRPEHGDWAIGK